MNHAIQNRSTGPTSVEGKAVSAQNARKDGIWNQAFNLLPGESRDELNALARNYFREFRPEGAIESALAGTAVKSIWLVYRYDRIEPVLVERAIRESGKSPDEAFVDLLVQSKNNNLKYVQQRRNQAQNHWFKALKELQRLQKLRGKQAKTVPAEMEDVEFVPQVAPESTDPTPSVAPDTVR